MKLLLSLMLLISFAYGAEFTVGVVNIQKVITNIKEGKDVMGQLEKSFKTKEKEVKAEESKIKALQEKYKKQSALLSDEAKLKKENEIRGKIAALQKKTMSFQKDIRKQEAQLKKPILEKLKPIIDKVSQDEGVSMTFEVSSSPVVYAKKQIDITKKVIKAYDSKHK